MTRLAADRDRVAFEPHGASVDWTEMRSELLGGVAGVSTARLERWSGTAGADLLEGLDLPDCHRYHEWWVAEREAARKLVSTVLEALAERLAGHRPEAALGHARARVALDPHDEAGHAAVMRLLGRLGRTPRGPGAVRAVPPPARDRRGRGPRPSWSRRAGSSARAAPAPGPPTRRKARVRPALVEA
jgi:DNA-binding SARP family transcriptional activator